MSVLMRASIKAWSLAVVFALIVTWGILFIAGGI